MADEDLTGYSLRIRAECSCPPPQTEPAMKNDVINQKLFELPLLPYHLNALEPYLSAATLKFHYGKHHQAYLDSLNNMVSGTAYAQLTLEELIRNTAENPAMAALFNNAAQVWNHTFFWNSMRPAGGGQPTIKLMAMITKTFGSFEAFKNSFLSAAVGQFGSGNVWLVQNGDKVRIAKTSNAETPIAYGQKALLVCDVWEHAYYLDYHNCRTDFVQNFLEHLTNWEFASSMIT